MAARGLRQEEAQKLLQQYGPNELPEARGVSLLARLLSQFVSPIIWLLLFALVFDIGVWLWEGGRGFPFEAIAIAAILFLYAGCVQNVEMALKMLEGVKAVQVHKEEQTVDVLFEPPATPLAIREQLLLGGYLAEPDPK